MPPNARLRQRSRRLQIDARGWLRGVERIVSPNHDPRPAGTAIELIVVHGISLPPGEFGSDAIAALFTNRLDCDAHPFFDGLRALRVSAHFLIRRDGRLLQFVSCLERAWHAGVSSWRGRGSCNDYSIGIEFEGTDQLPYESRQYDGGVKLIAALRASYPIAGVQAHSEIAPGRKTDPGPLFDWSRLDLPASLRNR